MAEDLLTRIQHELQERTDQLRPAVEERDRLRADLKALCAKPVAPRAGRRRMVSPKVLRLMLAPRRPALERPGIPRVSARTADAQSVGR